MSSRGNWSRQLTNIIVAECHLHTNVTASACQPKRKLPHDYHSKDCHHAVYITGEFFSVKKPMIETACGNESHRAVHVTGVGPLQNARCCPLLSLLRLTVLLSWLPLTQPPRPQTRALLPDTLLPDTPQASDADELPLLSWAAANKALCFYLLLRLWSPLENSSRPRDKKPPK